MKHLLATTIIILFFSSSAWAKEVYFNAELDATQANNGLGTGSPGTGSATDISYDSTSRVLTWSLSWSDLEADITAAHIHGPAAAGASGPALITLDTTTSPASGSAQLSTQQIDHLFAGHLYFNLHTAAHPGGEIRGQILPQPVQQSTVGSLPRNRWGSFVVRGNPRGLTIEQMFSGETALELPAEYYQITWILYSFNSNTQSYEVPALTDSLQQGQAFWMIQTDFDLHEIVVDNMLAHSDLKMMPGCISTHGCASIPLGAQTIGATTWAFIGSPHQTDTGDNVFAIADLAIQPASEPDNCQLDCAYPVAADAGLVGSVFFSYDADNNAYVVKGTDDSLKNGEAIWAYTPPQTEDGAIDLVVPYVEPEVLPDLELAAITDFQYSGAFRLKNGTFGASTLDYATGTLAVNPVSQSLFIAGHEQHRAVAEYPIIQGGMQTDVNDLPETSAPVQNFISVLDSVTNAQDINRITGMYWLDGSLIINGEHWYDATGARTDTTLIVPNADDLAADVKGYFRLQGAAQSAGYMGPIPEPWQSAFGAQHYSGWSSVYSILSRYSMGPTLWTFDPALLESADPSNDPDVPAQAKLHFPYNWGNPETHMSERALEWAEQGTPGPFPPADAVWNPMSAGIYGFFIPDTKTFAVIGYTAGLQSGIGYKAIQNNGNECGGECPYDPTDYTNYYWLFNVEDILSATNPHDPRPYAQGPFDVPFDANGTRRIIGATFDATTETLYLAIENAAQVQNYDRPPLIVTYKLSM